MARITNNANINLALAVWLLDDNYDYVRGIENYISVTTLMKPLRQIVLPHRIDQQLQVVDVEEFIARRLGHAIHDSVETTWTDRYHRPLKQLGHPDSIIDNIRVNPTDEEVRASNSIIPIYLEQRELREVELLGGEKWTIGGKFDFVGEGIVQDFKTTSAWSWIKSDKDANYQLQMSLYRWLDAGRSLRRIKEDYGRINFVFTDWSKMQLQTVPGYPDTRIKHKDIPLMSLEDTDRWVKEKLALVRRHWNTPESELPECTDEELWRSAPSYKYFSDPEKAKDPTARSSKNFDDLKLANAHLAEKGKGVVITKMGEPKACGFCPAFDGCTQKDRYL